ncbi:hypothetical protein GZ77_09580 [Endozoicomonas montiporae]|uniref:GyrI-like small molecule binding domain-containing protein n=2 Tax=Endozoicomonas montiporae TaxID=1027273 RepID=A0A081N7Z7_9GAMM|nr:GyrI-like domain-containing protein [Endozoicomonas montiporae]AMO55558.1 hypothetical protein EZMO1_1369 [Endozoicomonas montiporae CL-33]KEQ14570.1 hypothetical protein GZ77_09580 [Endozoicomonas montiporae]
MKNEWRKSEKELYIPKTKPQLIDIPKFNYFAINGKGNPNSDYFIKYIEALYAASYSVRMSHKSGFSLSDFFEYTVYPLEGIWDISDDEKQKVNGVLNKDALIYTLMIRQPSFVTKEFASEAIERASKKKDNPLIRDLQFISLEDGQCVQMLHVGSFDNEPETFKIMEEFCSQNNLERSSMQHREIYLSDFRKTQTDKLKTNLRFKVRRVKS